MEVLDLLNKKKLENVSLKKELDQYRQCDPQVLKKLKADTVTAIDAANRWTGMCVCVCVRERERERERERVTTYFITINNYTCMKCTSTSAITGPTGLLMFFIENVFTMKSWCKNQFGIEENIMDQQFGIPEDLDFI